MMYGLGAFAIVMMLVGMLFCFAVLAGIVYLTGVARADHLRCPWAGGYHRQRKACVCMLNMASAA